MPAISEITRPLAQEQQYLSDHPWEGVQEDYDRIYKRGQIEVGLPTGTTIQKNDHVRDNTVAILGAMFGDEGKGRFVDNKIASLLDKPQIDSVSVVRFQGGNNAGHTIELEDGTRVALHVVPSAIMYDKTIGIIDRGVVVHAEDLVTEIEYAEGIVGDLKRRIKLSRQAVLATDLERAEEVLNKRLTQGRSDGGTGRGIGPAYAHHYDRKGFQVADLFQPDWVAKFSNRYDEYEKSFASHGLDLASVSVPDFRKVKIENKNENRTVGSKQEFIDRLDEAKMWIITRDMTVDTIPLQREIFNDPTRGVLFEGAQGIGLNAWFGSYPDVTASDTSAWGIGAGTGVWHANHVAEKIGIVKGPYTSSVGERHLPTEIRLSRNNNDLHPNYKPDQKRGVYIRQTAREQGTTTGRWRDVANLDLACLAYNANMGGIDRFAVTMMDISRSTDTIPVSTHYRKDGQNVPYEPGMEYMQGLRPTYRELPGWDGDECARASTFDELPENAKKYLSFIQARTAVPIIAVTASPARDKLITLPGYNL